MIADPVAEKASSVRLASPLLTGLLLNYIRGPRHRGKWRIVRWIRRCLLGERRLLIPYAQGRIAIDERDYVQWQILFTGAYEPEVWAAIEANARGDEVLWDVGAHIGCFSLRAAQNPCFREIVAFEPSAHQRTVLKFNVDVNHAPIRVEPFALSDRGERRILYHGPSDNVGLSTLEERWGWPKEEIECMPLDLLVDTMKLPPPTMMKIDVEGWESRIIAGGEQTLRSRPPKALIIELAVDTHGTPLDQALVKNLSRFGYQLSRIEREGPRVQPRENFLALLNRAYGVP